LRSGSAGAFELPVHFQKINDTASGE
jgi:hypothetical protein